MRITCCFVARGDVANDLVLCLTNNTHDKQHTAVSTQPCGCWHDLFGTFFASTGGSRMLHFK